MKEVLQLSTAPNKEDLTMQMLNAIVWDGISLQLELTVVGTPNYEGLCTGHTIRITLHHHAQPVYVQ